MNRRDFLRGLVGGVVVAVASRSFPNRVFSFPSKISLSKVSGYPYDISKHDEIVQYCLRDAQATTIAMYKFGYLA